MLVKLTSLGRPLYNPADEPEAYAAYERQYIEALKPFEWETLTRAMELVRDDWPGLTWPPPGKIVQHAIRVEAERRGPDRGPRISPEFQLPPPPEITPEEREAMRAKLQRLSQLTTSGAIERMTEAEAKRFCETGDWPEGWTEAEAAAAVAKPASPRQKQRAEALQGGAAAARAAFLGPAAAAATAETEPEA